MTIRLESPNVLNLQSSKNLYKKSSGLIRTQRIFPWISTKSKGWVRAPNREFQIQKNERAKNYLNSENIKIGLLNANEGFPKLPIRDGNPPGVSEGDPPP